MDTLHIIFPYAALMAMVGLLETLLTFNLTDEMTETRGQPNRECIALGASNVVSGLFGGMGGCAMIGQTMINLSSGGRSRLSGVTAGVMILLFILFLSPLIERIPLAALVGVMFVVAQQTFAWGSLRVLGKVPLQDALVIVAVTVITVLTDLATAVLCGIVIAALNFAWQHARDMRADIDDSGARHARLPAARHPVFCLDHAFPGTVPVGDRPGPRHPRLPAFAHGRSLGHRRHRSLV